MERTGQLSGEFTINRHPVELILFDLGGVLIELGESPFHPDWIDPDHYYSVANWHQCAANRNFDRGRISAQQFASQFKQELGLSATIKQISDHFRNWPLGPYAGVAELLQSLGRNYRLAILTNTNALHWPRVTGEFDLLHRVDEVFASHQLNMGKPEAEIFSHVLQKLDLDAEKILFLDDSQANVDAARKAGMKAIQVLGFEAVSMALDQMGVEF